MGHGRKWFESVANKVGLEVDGVQVAFLDIIHLTLARDDEHAVLHQESRKSVREQCQADGFCKPDCSHYCINSSVHRAWNELLFAYILRPEADRLIWEALSPSFKLKHKRARAS